MGVMVECCRYNRYTFNVLNGVDSMVSSFSCYRNVL